MGRGGPGGARRQKYAAASPEIPPPTMTRSYSSPVSAAAAATRANEPSRSGAKSSTADGYCPRSPVRAGGYADASAPPAAPGGWAARPGAASAGIEAAAQAPVIPIALPVRKPRGGHV